MQGGSSQPTLGTKISLKDGKIKDFQENNTPRPIPATTALMSGPHRHNKKRRLVETTSDDIERVAESSHVSTVRTVPLRDFTNGWKLSHKRSVVAARLAEQWEFSKVSPMYWNRKDISGRSHGDSDLILDIELPESDPEFAARTLSSASQSLLEWGRDYDNMLRLQANLPIHYTTQEEEPSSSSLSTYIGFPSQPSKQALSI